MSSFSSSSSLCMLSYSLPSSLLYHALVYSLCSCSAFSVLWLVFALSFIWLFSTFIFMFLSYSCSFIFVISFSCSHLLLSCNRFCSSVFAFVISTHLVYHVVCLEFFLGFTFPCSLAVLPFFVPSVYSPAFSFTSLFLSVISSSCTLFKILLRPLVFTSFCSLAFSLLFTFTPYMLFSLTLLSPSFTFSSINSDFI